MSGGSDAASFLIPQALATGRLRLRPFENDLIDCRNEASIRLALAVGATLEREIGFADAPFHVYRHPVAD